MAARARNTSPETPSPAELTKRRRVAEQAPGQAPRSARPSLSWLWLALVWLCASSLLWFAQPLLANPQIGLPSAPAELDRSTPQRAVEHFITKTREGNFVEAAYSLDLRGIPAGQQTERGPELARKLRYVLDNALWIDVTELSDEPAGRPEDGALSEHLGSIKLRNSSVDIRLQRVGLASGKQIWVFSRGTVSAIPELYGQYGLGAFGEGLPKWAHRMTIFNLTLWQWIAALVGAVCATAGAFIAGSLIIRLARRLAARTVNRFDDALVARSRGPVRLILGIWFTRIWLDQLHLSMPAMAWLEQLLATALISCVTWFAMRVVYAMSDVILLRMTVSDESNEELLRHGQKVRVRGVRQAVNGLIFFVGGAIALTQFQVVKNLGVSLLASAGVVTVVIGFAAQKSVANLLAGIQISAAQPIRIGDRVKISEDVGWIEEITLTYVVMKTWDGRRRIFPITFFLENEFENWTKTSTQKLTIVYIHTDHLVPVEAVREAFMQIIKDAPDWDHETARLVVFEANAQSLVLRAIASASDAAHAWDLGHHLREKLLEFLQQLEGGRFLPRTRIEVKELNMAPDTKPIRPLREKPPQP